MKTTAANSPRHALRDGTRAGHDRVDAHFAEGLRSDAAYAVYLRGMQAFVCGVDAAIGLARLSAPWQAWAQTPRARWLQADLDALSLTAIAAPSSARLDAAVLHDAADQHASVLASRDGSIDADADADVDSDSDMMKARADARAAGAMYVMEGSALGARGLLGDAQRLGHDADRGAVFLSHHARGDDDGRRWPRFAAALGDDAFARPACQAAMLRAANAAFAHADACFHAAAAASQPSTSPANGSATDPPATAGPVPAFTAPSTR